MVRIAIVEDDASYLKQLKEYLLRYEQESGKNFHISVFHDGAEIAKKYDPVYDIILMDIEMRRMDGMTAAELIRRKDTEVVIIFITNMPQYAMKGYTVEAMDYVLKPISYYAFTQRIDRAIQRMRRRDKKFIAVNHQSGMIKLDVSQITYIEVQDHDLMYHTPQGSYNAKGTLTEAEQMLGSSKFFRCNKGYLVNLEYVESVQNYDVLVGNTWIQVSRPKKKALMDALNDYMNEVSK